VGEPSRRSPERRAAALDAAVAAAAVLPGLVFLRDGSGDPVGLLAWLALCAPAVGAALGARGRTFWGVGPPVLGAWGIALAWTVALGEASALETGHPGAGAILSSPLFGLAAVAGLLGIGWFLGASLFRAGDGVGAAAAALLVGLLLAGASVLPGITAGRSEPWGARRPALGRALLDVSPLVLVLECAGSDWTRAQPLVYRASGVEWFPRAPYRGESAGASLAVLGAVLGSWGSVGAMRRRQRAERSAGHGADGP